MVSKIGAKYYVRYIFLLWIVLLERQVEWAQGLEDSSETESDDVNVTKGNEESTAVRAQDVSPRIAKPADREEEEINELLKLAVTSFQQHNYEKAISEYTKAIEKRPLVAQYHALRAGSHWRNGNLSEAESDFRRAILLSGFPQQTLNTRLHLINVLIQAKKYNEALEEVIRTNDHAQIAKLGDRFVDAMQYDLAFKCYDEAIKRNANELVYYRKRAKCSSQLRNFGSAVSDYRKILATNPNSLDDRKALVDTLFFANEFKDAIQETFLTDASKFENLADKFRTIGKTSSALYCYTEAIRKEPENKGFYLKRGKLYLKEQKLDKAIKDFRTVLETQPDLTYARRLLVRAFLDSQDIVRATKEMSKLNDDELYYLAYEMFLDGKSEKALHCCTEAIKQNSKKAKNFRLRGNCHKKLGNFKAAIEDFRVVVQIEKEPPQTDFLLEFSQLLLDNGKYLEAETVLTPIGQNNLSEDEAVYLLNIYQRIKEMKTQPGKLPIGGDEGKDSESLPTSSVPPHETPTRHDDMNQEEGGTLGSLPTTGAEVELLEAPVQPAMTQPSTSDTALKKRKERADETYSSDLQLALKSLIGARESGDDNSHDGQSDKFDMLAKIWTHDLRNVTDPKQMLFAKKAISDVLFEAQLGTLRRNSVIIDPTLDKTTDMEKD